MCKVMKFRTLYLLLLVACCLFQAHTANAQISKYTIWVAPFSHDTTGKKFDQYMLECRGASLRFLLASGRFTVVDRDATKELESERKLQKSESFIDGKVVEQGRATGAEYILTGKMNSKTGILALVVTSVTDNSKVEGGDCNLKESFFFGETSSLTPAQTNKKVTKTMSEMLTRWLAKDRYTVVKELEGDEDSVDKMLIAAGSTRGVKKGVMLEVFYTEMEEVDGSEIERDVLIGEMKVDVVENANFSVAKVKDGKKDIKKALNEHKKLYCRIKLKN
jgi:Peptidoglycan-synthase activator LpoB